MTGDLREFRVKRGVAGKEHTVGPNADHPARPQCRIPVPRVTSGEMLRRSAEGRNFAEASTFPPIHFSHVGYPALYEKLAHPKRGDPFRSRKPSDQKTRCCVVEVIVVIVRYEDSVDGRELVEGQARRCMPPRTGKLGW
jgi:hypothetical protein